MRGADTIINFFTEGLAVDLGTTNTRIYCADRGLVLDEPSVVALEKRDGRVAGVGTAAHHLLGREPVDLAVHCPVRAGVVENVDAAEKMLSAFVKQVRGRRARRCRLIIGVPGSSTSLERRAVRTAALDANAVHVDLIEAGLAAALGGGLDDDDQARLVIDIGGGTTDVAVVIACAVVSSTSVKIGGHSIDAAIQNYVRTVHGIQLGERTAERIKRKAGAIMSETDRSAHFAVVGKRLADGFPTAIDLRVEEVHEAIHPVVERIGSVTRQLIERLSADAATDVHESGVLLTGGGALLHGVDVLLGRALQLQVRQATDPASACVLGVGRLLARPATLERAACHDTVRLWEKAESF